MVSAARMSRRTKKPAAGGAPGTFTLYPTAQSGSIVSDHGAYANARSGSGAGVASYPSASILAGQVYSPGGSYSFSYYSVYQGFVDFDTSGVTGTISSATLSLGLSVDDSSVDFTAQARVRDWGATLTAADYVPGADLGALTLAATLASSGIGAVDLYKAMTENGSNLRNAINQAGFTRLILCSDRTVSNVVQDDAEWLGFYSYNNATLKPKLVVVTT